MATAQLLTAKPLVEILDLEFEARAKAIALKLGRPAKLVVVIVGTDPASQIYVASKAKRALKLGMASETLSFDQSTSPGEVREAIEKLNLDPTVDGILIQRPLPKAFREDEVMYWVTPKKDVDAFHPDQIGRLSLGVDCFAPCTPAGVIRLLEHYGVSLAGKTACVVGRSSIVGKPMAALLLARDATLIQVHSRTKNPEALARLADVLIVAAGKPKLVGPEWVKPGAVVVDVGIHRGADGKVFGDVDFERVSQIASSITPVPGSVGPMTITQLMDNVLVSAERLG